MIDENKLNKNLLDKFLKLKEIIINSESAAVAYSGGVDSTLLSFLSHNILAQKSLIITVNSEFISECEFNKAKFIAEKYGFNYKIIDLSVFNNLKIIENNPKRCKFCKETVFKEIIALAKEDNIKNIFDGSNINDLEDYRPGFEAIKELQIRSPFIEANISKSEIRGISGAFDIPNWNKPALACLASRIPYNTVITLESLKKVEKAEEYLNNLGYYGCRVRHHDLIARIVLANKDIEKFIFHHKDIVDKKLKEIGYTYVCIDLKGYKTGSLNALIDIELRV